MAAYSSRRNPPGRLRRPLALQRLMLPRWSGLAALSLALLALTLSSPSAWAEEGDEDPFFQEPALVRRLREFKARAGPLVPPDARHKPGAHRFSTTKGGVSLNGAVWFEDDQLVVDALLETEGQTFIPQRLKLWAPDGRALESQVRPQPPTAAGPSEPPVSFNIGFGFSAPRRKRRHRHAPRQAPQQKQQQSQKPCTDCPGGYHAPQVQPQPEHHEHPPEHRRPRFTPRAGIAFTPTAPTGPPPPPPTQHRFPGPPCPRRLKGWSIGAMGPGPGRSIPLVAFLDEPPGAFVRTAPCQVLVVMTIPPGGKGARKTMREIARAQGLTLLRSIALPSINTLVALMEVSGPAPLANFLPGLQSHAQVQYAQPNHLYRTTAYNDPLADLQYGPKLIDADRAHQTATGREVPVAIIDTGIDGSQPDLRGKVTEQIDLIGPDPPGLEGIHGTLMSGVIGATENNRVGVYGVAPHVRLLGLKACQPVPENPVEAACSSESIARALDLAIRRKVRLINMSLGGPPDRLVETLVLKAAQEDIAVVAAAGNEGPKAPPSYPAAYDPVLAVSAVDLDDQRYDKANVGTYIDLSAPGVDIVSTLPGDRFNVFSGTSLATAHVTAVAALLIQARPGLSLAELTEALETTAVDLGRRGRDPRFGAGRINACRALERVTGKATCP